MSNRNLFWISTLLLLAFLALALMGCAKEEPFQYCPSNQSIPTATGQPTVLVIGDSISIGYTPYVKAALTNYDVVHNPCNAMNTDWTLSQVDSWLAGRPTFEAITWNNGLWDIASWSAVSDASYEANLHAIAAKIKAKTAHPLFILSTTVPAGADGRNDASIVRKNQIAVTVMQAEGIPVVDLYTVSLGVPHSAPTDVHFTDAGYATLSQSVLTGMAQLGVQ